MLARITSSTLRGVDSYTVDVEVSLMSGLPSITVVGLPEGAVREARERVLASIRNAGFSVPPRRITVNLAPADVPKEGSAFDLPIAVGLLVGSGVVDPETVAGVALLGELGLDGALRRVRGALPMAAQLARDGVHTLILPFGNGAEAAAVLKLAILEARTLGDVVAHFQGRGRLEQVNFRALAPGPQRSPEMSGDLADIRGQEHAKRALEIAAAGGHNVLLMGPPGTGKTMLARRIPGILPPLTLDEAMEVTAVHSVAGLLPPGESLLARRPFRAPHHGVSGAGLVGGGSRPRPGEVSLAHNGVLFLDELAEFPRGVLDRLRQPLEDGSVVVSRVRQSVRFPARFMLVAAMNPCPCGYLGDGTTACTCDPAHVRRYRGRISGPLLDRIDLHVIVGAVPVHALGAAPAGESSDGVRRRVLKARAIQALRFPEDSGLFSNARMTPQQLSRYCRLTPDLNRFLERASAKLGLSARGYHRVLRVARTIADLSGTEEIGPEHVAEALQHRALAGGRSGA